MSEVSDLLERIKRFEQIIDGTNIGTWEWNFQTGESHFNQAWAKMIGYELEELSQNHIKSWTSLIHPEDIENWNHILDTHISGSRKFYKCELRLKHKSGHWVWVLNKGKVTSRTDDGKALWLSGSHLDISERKNREELLENVEDLLYKAKELANIGTMEVDMETNQTEWCPMLHHLFEVRNNHKFTLSNLLEFFKAGKTRDDLSLLINEAIEFGRGYDIECKIVTAKGNEKWLRAIGIPELHAGKCKKLYGLFLDIDERKRMNNVLEISEQQFRTTFENAPNGIAIMGLSGQWLRVNASLCVMLGYTEEELLNLRFEEITHPDDIDQEQKHVQELIEGNRSNYKMDKRFFHKNGEIVWALMVVSLVYDEDKNPLHFVSHISDITQLKNSQQKIQSLLNITHEQNSNLLNFAHIVSHNLRSHVGNFAMLLDLIRLEAPESTENDFFPLLQQSTESLDETIIRLNQVVAIPHPIELVLDDIELSACIKNVLVSLQAELEDAKIDVINEISESPMIKGVSSYIESILRNFLNNIIKYRSITVQPWVRFSTEEIEGTIALIVEDNGLGIDLNLHGNKLFGMYNTQDGKNDARGVDLLLSKSQIESMNGTLEVKSDVNKGTKFKIIFQKCD